MNFDEFFEFVRQSAQKYFQQNGEHLPLFYMYTKGPEGSPGSIGLAPANWSDTAQKDRKFSLMRAGLELGIFDYVCVVHEVWTARDAVPEGQAIDISKVIPPSQRADRGEALMLLGADLNQQRAGSWEIKRAADNKATLGKFQTGKHFEMMSQAFRKLAPEKGPAN
jgi:hypothetical protein